MANIGGANRIELESQILSASLRQSWADMDPVGVAKAREELTEIYPDLLPEASGVDKQKNYYDLLQVECDVNPSSIEAAYLKAVKALLRDSSKFEQENKQKYFDLLNAGVVLRKPRLRISHDLVSSACILPSETEVEPDETPAESMAPPGESSIPHKPKKHYPMLIELLLTARFIGPAELQALENQMARYPDIPLVDLILWAGYATDDDIKALELAEYLLHSGQITNGKFTGIDFDTTGERTDEDWHPPPGTPPDPQRVPKRPYPNSWTGGVALPEPKGSRSDE